MISFQLHPSASLVSGRSVLSVIQGHTYQCFQVVGADSYCRKSVCNIVQCAKPAEQMEVQRSAAP